MVQKKGINEYILFSAASHIFPISLKAKEWTVLHDTFLGKQRAASLATDLLKATYRKRR